MDIDLKNIQRHTDAIMEKVAIGPLKDQMQLCQNGLMKIIKDYSFLFGNDIEKTREVLLATFFTDIKDGDFIFNKEEFLAAVPKETKEAMFEKVFVKFLENADVDALKEQED